LVRALISGRLGWRALGLLAVLAALAAAQERPLSLEGVMSSGFYTAFSRDVTNTRVSFVPLSLNLDATGFLGDPGFLSYRVQPMLTNGLQASEAGFLGGNGVAVDTTVLGGRSFPLKLHYSNVKREDVFFGSLNQVSGYRSMNHERSFGLNWQLTAPRLPRLNLDVGNSSLTTEPDVSQIPAYNSHNRRYAFNLRDERLGWTIDADLRRTELQSDFGAMTPEGLAAIRLDQDMDHAGVIARRPLWRGAAFTFNAGATNDRHVFDSHPYVQDLRYAEGSLDLGQASRWQGRVRMGYNSSLLGADIAGTGVLPSSSQAAPAETLYAVQVGAFADRDRAERFREQMQALYGAAEIIEKAGEPVLSRVVVGTAKSKAEARELAMRVQKEAGGAFIVPLQPNLPSGSVPETAVPAFVSYRSRFSNISLEGESRLQITKGLSLITGVHRERVLPQQGLLTAASSDYLYGTAGIGFQHRFSWASFGGHANLSLGRMVYAGVPNRFQGRSYSFNAQRGTVDGLELSASLHYSAQRARQLTTLSSGSSGGELGIGRRLGALTFRGGAGVNRTFFRDPSLNYRSAGLSFRGEVQFRQLHASYSRNRSAGNTLSVYFVTPITDPASSSLLLGVPLRAAVYANTGDTFIFRATPLRRLDASVTWLRGRQWFDTQTVNDYEQMDARATFRYRLLSWEFGYVRYRQSLLLLPGYLRSRIYFRVSRSFEVF